MQPDLSNRVAIVTGGSQNQGKAIAVALAAAGAKILLVARSHDKLAAAQAELQTQGADVAICAADLTESAQALKAVAAAVAEFGRVDIVVNSVGTFVWKKFADFSDEAWQQSLAVNLSAPFYMTQSAAKQMSEQGEGGCIVNIASVHATVADPNTVGQCASKAGLVAMSKSAAEALRSDNIRVHTISPGAIEPNSSAVGTNLSGKVTHGDVAQSVLFLVSAGAQALTGLHIEAHGITRPVVASK